jgi:chemotaxis protein CheY-P-specific phosphatase CheC
MQHLNDFELEVVGEVVENAVGKSVKAMESMLKIRIKPDHMEYGNGPLRKIGDLDTLGRFKVHLVKMALIGDVKGAFYFAINSHEVDLINRVCLPQGFLSDTRSAHKEMSHGFMTEIENMIASLSIDELSNSLGVELLSAVPKVKIMQGSEVNRYLIEENFINKTAFHVKVVLAGVAVNIAPYFLWMLDENFIEKVKLNTVS